MLRERVGKLEAIAIGVIQFEQQKQTWGKNQSLDELQNNNKKI